MRTIQSILLLFIFIFSSSLLAQISSPANLSAEYVHFDYAGLANDAVRLTWDKVKDASGTDVPLYNVYRAEGTSNNTADFKFIGQSLWNNFYLDLEVELGKTYTYYVTSKKNNDESSPSKFVTIKVGDKPVEENETASLAGKVTDESTGNPLKGVNVILNTINTTIAASATTDSEGKYKIETKPGDYKVLFKATSGYHSEFYDNVYDAGDAKIVKLNNNDAKTGIDAALKPVDKPDDKDGIASISGRVTDDDDDSPLRGVMVILTSVATNLSRGITTDSEGKFKLEVKPGEYKLYFKAIPGYQSEYWKDKKNENEADIITLNDQDALTGFHAALKPIITSKTYMLSGRVLNEGNLPVKTSIHILTLNVSNVPQLLYETETNSEGNYGISVPEGTEVIVYAQPSDEGYIGEFFDNTVNISEAKKILVSADINNIDFILEKKVNDNAGLNGTVFGPDNEKVKSMIIAFKLGSLNNRSNYVRAITDDEGKFVFEHLAAGEYILFAMPELGYIPTFYKIDGSMEPRWEKADVLILKESSELSNIDFTLKKMPIIKKLGFARISGIVSDPDGNPLSDAFVHIYDMKKELVSYCFTDREGRYITSELNPGSYSIACDNLNYIYNEKSDVRAEDSEYTIIDFTLLTDNTVEVENDIIQNDYVLDQNYPNPFNPSTIIKFYIANKGDVKLTVYNILGVKIATLLNEELSVGTYNVTFDGSDLSSGVYIYELLSNNFRQSKKMMLIK